MERMGKWLIIFVMLLLGFCHQVSAHTLWINLTDYSPRWHQDYGAATKLYMGWGHHYPAADFLRPEALNGLSMVGPEGDKKELTPGPGGLLATRVEFEGPGGYILCAVKKPGYYTMYEKGRKVHHKLGPKEGLEGVILSLYFEQYAKALINVGKVKGNPFEKPVGHRLEIVPLANPYSLKGDGGHLLPVKVLFDGKPAKYVRVYATYMGFSTRDDFAFATFTDGEGVARIRLLHWGPWLIKAVKKSTASGDMREKCDEISLIATLTFEVP